MKYKHTRKEIAKWLSPSASFGYLYKEVIDMLLEPAEWPLEGDKYWAINTVGQTFYRIQDGGSCDDRYKEFGNCFRTKKEAIKARDKIKSLLRKV